MTSIVELFQRGTSIAKKPLRPSLAEVENLVAPRGWQYFPQPVVLDRNSPLQKILVYRLLPQPDASFCLHPWWRFPKARWPDAAQRKSLSRQFLEFPANVPVSLGEQRYGLRWEQPGEPVLFLDCTGKTPLPAAQVLQQAREIVPLLHDHVPFFPPLREEERALLLPLLRAQSTAQIARSLELSPGQVAARIQKLYRQYGVRNRKALAIALWKAYRHKKSWFLEVHTMKKALILLFVASIGWNAFPPLAMAEEKGQDLPFLHRYPGSRLIEYLHAQFDELRMPLGPFDKNGPSKYQDLQGEGVYLRYFNPKDRSSLEILGNYQQTLHQQGFKTLWQCANKTCNVNDEAQFYNGPSPLWHAVPGFKTHDYDRPRMVTERLDSPNSSQTWVFLSVSGTTPQGGGETYIYAVQTKPMQTGLVQGDRELTTAAEMGQALGQQGRFAMHIPFDYNQATIRPDAQAQLQQLAATLRQHPEWMIGLDGHTDAVGGAEFNQKL
ncbi:MAG: hypothetical protein JJ693_08690, partial [Acidithiobacillus sp.]|nr:hypothetical protein [Acidithiobacillus sp.]